MATKTGKQNIVIKKIEELAKDVWNTISRLKQPELEMPIRALSNVKYDEKEGYFKIQDRVKLRTLTASTIKTFSPSFMVSKAFIPFANSLSLPLL